MLKISPVSRDEKRWWLDTVERRNEIIKKEAVSNKEIVSF